MLCSSHQWLILGNKPMSVTIELAAPASVTIRKTDGDHPGRLEITSNGVTWHGGRRRPRKAQFMFWEELLPRLLPILEEYGQYHVLLETYQELMESRGSPVRRASE